MGSSSKAAKCHLKSRTAASGRVLVVPADCCIKTKCQGWIQKGKFYWINGQETVKQPFLFKMHEELQGRNGEVLSYRGSFQPFPEYQWNAVLCGAMVILAPKSKVQPLEIPRLSHE